MLIKFISFSLFLALVLWSQNTSGQQAPDNPAEEKSRGYFTFYLDNDLFSGEDQDYTNGARASWISENRPAFGYLPARQLLEKLSGYDDSDSLIRRLSGFERGDLENDKIVENFGFSLTQLMFTPADFESPTQPPGERRYAGWLGVGFSLHVKSERVLNSAELILGSVGPRSYAEESQDFVHDLRDIPKFQGWNDQIPNEFTLDLSFIQKRRIEFLNRPVKNFSVDGFTEWGARLGSFRTLAHAGGFVRFGFHLPADFTDTRISATSYTQKLFHNNQASSSDWSAYGLAGAGARGVLFDATLDGPLFKNFETGNTREPWVGEAYLGFGLRWKKLEFSYVHTFRSEEYKEQMSGSEFGSLALVLRL